jgi:uncharacterized membrane protein
MKFHISAENGKTQLLTALVIATNVAGNVLLSRGMHQVGRIVSASPVAYASAFMNVWAIAGMLILTSWMVLELALLSRADLSFVLPVTGSSYALIAIAGHFFLHDRISAVHWVAIIAVTAGVVLAEETPARTTMRRQEHPE